MFLLENTHDTKVSINKKRHSLPNISLKTMFAITFGFCGVNMAFSLQTSQMSRIFQTLGADPNKLGFFFIFPPLIGMIIQPLLGKFSDGFWSPRFGRRMPLLMFSAPMAAIIMVLLPNAGSFGFGYASMGALVFGSIAIILMDLSNNACMQPFRMIIGDMVNENQKDKAWSWQQSFSNLGGVLANICPFVLTWIGVANVDKKGVVPLSVRLSFYIAAVILLLISAYTILSVKEYDPKTYAQYHNFDYKEKKEKKSYWTLIKEAPKTFWEVAFIQFFAYFGIQYLWTYTTGAIAQNVWHTANSSSGGFQAAGNWYGILTFVQSVVGILYGFLVLSRTSQFKRKFWYRIGLFCGGLGMIWVSLTHNQYALILAFVLIGVCFLTMHTEPFAIFTTATDGQNDGAYIGLFNVFICLPQIIASVSSFVIFPLVGNSMAAMVMIGGISWLIGAALMSVIKTDSHVKSETIN
ncbi:SLC45 family MFS transporter [Paucilactobacillus hokkaidonensis]|uniref:SLC45 family MFS transporter n=1 Tax=Paucilactobacillus hokkaidonensis TaxID=1193095 RepID=UPI000597A88C|nr:SLC45 family MFS transporter [Paucilactobacillus hokkaidonensis]